MMTGLQCVAQSDNPWEVDRYPFVNYDTNYIFNPVNPEILQGFFGKLDTLLFQGKGQVSILHLGGSHIQTDVYTHRVRTRLQALQPGTHGGRGLIFPVTMAGSNNPRNYSVSYSGHWNKCKNTERNRSCNLGISGMVVYTSDSAVTLTIRNQPAPAGSNHTLIRVFHFDALNTYRISLLTDDPFLVHSVETDIMKGFTDIRLNYPVDTFTLEMYRVSNQPSVFELYGIELKSDEPGIIYSALGVNGASIPSFLRCNLLKSQMQTLNPDLVIISLGTNDGFAKQFDQEVYKENYARLLNQLREACPHAEFILTVPNDVYIKKRRTNKNTSLQEEVIYQLAEQYHCGIWNFFQVMGGLNSVPLWYTNGMMQKDRIHFTARGYLLKGDLLFSALMKSYGQYLGKKNIL